MGFGWWIGIGCKGKVIRSLGRTEESGLGSSSSSGGEGEGGRGGWLVQLGGGSGCGGSVRYFGVIGVLGGIRWY